MPARTGEQDLAGLRESSAEVYLLGQRVPDVTAHPGLRTHSFYERKNTP